MYGEELSGIPSSKDNGVKPIHFGVIQPTPYFVGRVEEVRQPSDRFLNRSQPILVISGMGGQGKTELCRKFITTLKTQESSLSVIWLGGDGASVLNSDIIRLAQFLRIPIHGKPIMTEILSQISAHFSTNWLLVIDNVDEMYPDFLQTVSVLVRHGAFVIVTTRRLDIFSGEGLQMKLDILKSDEAQLLIQNNLDKTEKEDVKRLCHELGNHVLALRHAISYINAQKNENMDFYGIKDYLDELARDKSLLQNKVNFLDGYDQTIFLIVTRTLQTIHDNYGRRGQSAVEIMQILCLILPDGISMKALQKIVDAAKIFQSQPQSQNEELHQVLLLLKKYSLIFYDGQASLSIHRLVQKVAKSSDFQRLKLILDAFSVEDSSKRDIRQLISIWQHADSVTAKEYSNYPFRISTQMLKLSMVLEMKSFADRSLQLLTQLLGSEHKNTLSMKSCAARALLENGEYAGALNKFKELLDIQKRILDKNDTEILATSGNIARVLGKLKRY